jgi:hypothetical protein
MEKSGELVTAQSLGSTHRHGGRPNSAMAGGEPGTKRQKLSSEEVREFLYPDSS